MIGELRDGKVYGKLDPLDMAWSAMAGVLRCTSAVEKDRPQSLGLPKGQRHWAYEIDGAIGERVTCDYLGLAWTPLHPDGVIDKSLGDVGPHIEVRACTDYTNRKRLIIHKREEGDALDSLFYFVTLQPPAFTIHGCIMAIEAQVEGYWKDPGTGRPAYFVGRDELAPCRGGFEVPDWVWAAQLGHVGQLARDWLYLMDVAREAIA